MPGGIKTGTVVDLASRRAGNYNLDSYVKHMGFDPIEPVDYEAVPFGKELGTDLNTTLGDEYANEFKRLNQYGVQLAARGVDIMNPGQDPGARNAASVWHALRTEVERKAMAIKASSDIRNKITEEQAKGSYAPKFEIDASGRPRVLDATDMQGVVNYKGVMEEMAKAVDDINRFATQYPTENQAILYNQHIAKAKSEFIDGFKRRFSSLGLPEEIYTPFIQDMVGRIGPASKDATEAKLAESKRQFNTRESRIKAESEKEGATVYSVMKELQSVFEGGEPSTAFESIMQQASGKPFETDGIPQGTPFFVGAKLPNGKFIKSAYMRNGKLQAVVADADGEGEEKMPLTTHIFRQVLPAAEFAKFDAVLRANNLVDKDNVISRFDADQLKYPGATSKSSYQSESRSAPSTLDLLPEGL
jgi:hypothetical protein